jgi:hypothetical protein
MQHNRPSAEFDGICVEAREADVVAAFWGVALRGRAHYLGDGRYRVDPAPGRPRHEIVRVNTVPDIVPGAGRAHLDLRLPGRDPHHLVDAGAEILRRPGLEPWYVLADPEGNEFCAYPGVDARPPGVFQFVVKCRDARGLAKWWAEVLGGEVSAEGESAVIRGAPEFPWDFMVFDPVPEPKVAGNRLHWHVELPDSRPSDLTAMGAQVRQEPDDAHQWWLLTDPEGNEFCAG